MQTCPDCREPMQPIQLLDETHQGKQRALSYAASDARPSIWHGRIPVAGKVFASICLACSRIVLRGEPPSELAPSDAPTGRGDEPTPPAERG
jgi:hypothetical protein